jgi:enoyl-CoA hydratase/carnithine racemase
MDQDTLLGSQNGPVPTLALNRPETPSACNARMGDELDDALDRADSDDSTRGAIMTARVARSGGFLVDLGRPVSPDQ